MKCKFKLFSLIFAILMVISMITPVLAIDDEDLGLDEIVCEELDCYDDSIVSDDDFMETQLEGCLIHSFSSWSPWSKSVKITWLSGVAYPGGVCHTILTTYERSRNCSNCTQTETESYSDPLQVVTHVGVGDYCRHCGKKLVF